MMSKELFKMPSIESPKVFFKNLNRVYSGRNVKLVGTVKIHGTNGSVVVSRDGTIYAQSKNRVLSIDSDNHGFAQFVSSYHPLFLNLPLIYDVFKETPDMSHIVIYGEWCGGNIQKGVGVTGMPKSFVVFGCVGIVNGERRAITRNVFRADPVNRTYNVEEFGEFEVTVNKHSSDEINGLMGYVDKVEEECPVAASLNPDSECKVGEGVVWKAYNPETLEYLGFFKTKGEKHARTSKRTGEIKNVISEQAESVLGQFALKVAHEDRLCQGLEYLREMGLDDSDPRNMGEYLKWVNQDILKEHTDDLNVFFKENETEELDWKKLAKRTTTIARQFFLARD